MGINKIYGKLKGNKKVSSLLMMIVGLVVITFSLAFFTDSKENILGLKIKSYTPSHVVFEYDLSKGDGYVNARDEDLAKQGVKVYKGNYEQNKVDINKGFDNYDYELQGLTSRDSLKSKLGETSGMYTVVLTEFTGTGDSPNNKGLIGVPYFDILGLNTTDLSGMFKGASSFKQDITVWDVSNVSNMSNMFEGTTSFSLDLFDWGVKENVLHVGFNEGATNLPDYKLPKIWQDSYKVVFRYRGRMVKTIHEGYHTRPLNSTSEGDLSLPAEPERHTYEFTGWETSEGLTYSESMEMPNNDVIFEAQWKKVKVEIDTGDDIIDVEVDDSGNITLPDLEDKVDQEFGGWEDQDGNIIEGGTDVDYTEGDKYTPIWKPKEYTVTFRGHNNTVLKTQTVNHGGNATAPSNPSRTGYTFTGWDKVFTNITGNITVNAKWKIRQYTVTFRGHNNTVLKTQTVNHGGNATAPSKPSRTGYTFTGWDRGFTNVTGNITVNAKWVISSSTFSYTGGNQTFNVDVDGKYKIDVSGARGVSSGGYGGRASATFDLYRGDNVVVYVGGQGQGTVVRVNGSVIIAGGGGGGRGGTAGGTGGSGTYNGTDGSPGGSYTEHYDGYWGTAWGTRYWTDENGVRQSEQYSEPHWNPPGTRTVSYSSTPGDGGKNEIASRGTNKLLQNGVNSGNNGSASITWIEPHN